LDRERIVQEIGAFEAKMHFSRLLARVRKGEAFIVTHRGRAVARLVPAEAGIDPALARAAAERVRAVARSAKKSGRFDWNEWRRYRDEGRR
jgi:prevent-host-death family protein